MLATDYALSSRTRSRSESRVSALRHLFCGIPRVLLRDTYSQHGDRAHCCGQHPPPSCPIAPLSQPPLNANSPSASLYVRLLFHAPYLPLDSAGTGEPSAFALESEGLLCLRLSSLRTSPAVMSKNARLPLRAFSASRTARSSLRRRGSSLSMSNASRTSTSTLRTHPYACRVALSAATNQSGSAVGGTWSHSWFIL